MHRTGPLNEHRIAINTEAWDSICNRHTRCFRVVKGRPKKLAQDGTGEGVKTHSKKPQDRDTSEQNTD